MCLIEGEMSDIASHFRRDLREREREREREM